MQAKVAAIEAPIAANHEVAMIIYLSLLVRHWNLMCMCVTPNAGNRQAGICQACGRSYWSLCRE